MKLLIIDKFPVIRIGLSVAINNCTIEDVESLDDFQKNKTDFKPDLIIQGLSADVGGENLKTVIQLRRKFPHAGLIVYDEYPNSILLLEYVKAGIQGHLAKHCTTHELNECIKEISKGNRYFNNKELIDMIFHITGNQDKPAQKKLNLTANESEIANFLCNGMRTSWIAEQTGRKMSTISTIKANIFKKLNTNNIIELKDALENKSFELGA